MPRPRKARVVPPRNTRPEPGIRWNASTNSWRVDTTVHGKRHTKTFATLTEARDWKAAIRSSPPVQPTAPALEVMTVGKWIARYLDDLDRDARTDPVNALAPRTRHGYREKLERYTTSLTDLPLRDLEPLAVRAWVRDVQDTWTINAAWEAHRRFKGCLAAAVRARLIPYNPCDGWNPPKGERSAKAKGASRSRWSDEQATQVLAALDHPRFQHSPIKQLMKVWLATGLRRQEIWGLRWQDIDFETQTITVRHTVTLVGQVMTMREKTKTGEVRPVTFDLFALEALKAQRTRVEDYRAARPLEWREHDLVFPSERGKPMSLTLFRRWYKLLCDAAKVPQIRPYDLRSTHGSALYFKTDMTDKDAAARMGHSVQTYLETYVRPLAVDQPSGGVNTQNLYAPHKIRTENPEASSEEREAK